MFVRLCKVSWIFELEFIIINSYNLLLSVLYPARFFLNSIPALCNVSTLACFLVVFQMIVMIVICSIVANVSFIFFFFLTVVVVDGLSKKQKKTREVLGSPSIACNVQARIS